MYIPGTLFSTELFWTAIKWLMIFGVWGVFAIGTWRENRNIRQLLNAKKDTADSALLRTLHRRDMQIWVQLSLLLFVVAANDVQHDAGLLPKGFFAPPPAPVSAPVVQEVPNQKYEDILKKSNPQGLPFSDITEFNENNSKQEAYIDWLKEHYESWFITFYYLQKCKAAGAEDYTAIRSSLERELDAAHAGKDIENNILTAANGSYKEMYGDIPCDAAHMTATKNQYDVNMQQIRASFPSGSPNAREAPLFSPSGTR